MKKLRWGILSTANIGVTHVIPAMQKSSYLSIDAIASRDTDKAEEVAQKLGIPKSYGAYEDLLEDENIDAIYNPLPNHLHVSMTLKALAAGKHVLCEKPIAMDFKEAEQLADAFKKYPELKVMEAFMYRFHPQWELVKKWIKAGEVGQIQTINSIFTYYNDDPDNIRNKAGIGGGGLMDIGCYNISASRYLFEEEPIDIIGEMELDPDFGVDVLASGILRFPSGMATFTCSTQASPEQSLSVFGTEGLIEMETPFNPLENISKITLKKNGEIIKQEETQANHYTLQGEAFSKAILDNTPVPTPLEDAVANMKVIDALLSSRS